MACFEDDTQFYSSLAAQNCLHHSAVAYRGKVSRREVHVGE